MANSMYGELVILNYGVCRTNLSDSLWEHMSAREVKLFQSFKKENPR